MFVRLWIASRTMASLDGSPRAWAEYFEFLHVVLHVESRQSPVQHRLSPTIKTRPIPPHQASFFFQQLQHTKPFKQSSHPHSSTPNIKNTTSKPPKCNSPSSPPPSSASPPTPPSSTPPSPTKPARPRLASAASCKDAPILPTLKSLAAPGAATGSSPGLFRRAPGTAAFSSARAAAPLRVLGPFLWLRGALVS